MIEFAEFVAFARDRDAISQVQHSASAFLALSGFSGLIVTLASTDTPAHQVLFAQGYPTDCVEHVRSRYVVDDPYYRDIKASMHAPAWHAGFKDGFEARTWLIPAGYRNGTSMSLQDEHGEEVGSVHTNTRRETLGDRQFDALDALRGFLTRTLSIQIAISSIGLTLRESEVIRHVVAGASNPEIAENLHISRRTVATHIENILQKLGVRSRVEIAVTALRLGLA